MRFRYSILFILLWVFVLILYPSWLLPSSTINRFIIFTSLIVMIIIGILILRTKSFPKKTKEINLKDYFKDKYSWILLIASLIFIFSHIPLMKLPITTGDEGYHIARGIWLIEPLNQFTQTFLHISIFTLAKILITLIAALFLIYYFYFKEKPSLFLKNKITKKVLIILSILIGYIYFFIINKFASIYHFSQYGTTTLDHLNWLIWYGPVSAIVYAIQIIISGYTEFGVRFIQPIFIVLTAVYIFKLTSLFKNKKTALTASLIFLFLPSIFYYSSISLLDTGLIFFVTSSMFYFMRYNKEGDVGDLLLCLLFFNLGFLYKNPIVLLVPIYIFYIILTKNIKFEQVKVAVIGLVAVLPQLMLSRTFDAEIHGSFVMSSFSNWISLDLVTTNFLLIKDQATVIIFILFTIGLLYSIYLAWKEKDKLNLLLLLWFVIWYAAFVSYFMLWTKGLRLTLPYLPVVAILTAQVIYDFLSKYKKKIPVILISLLIIYLLSTSLYLNYNRYADRYIPYDKMFNYIKYNVNSDKKIFAPMISPPYPFYIKKYDIKNKIIEETWEDYDKQTLKNLHEYLTKNNISYVMWPMPEPIYDAYIMKGWTVVEYPPSCEERAKIIFSSGRDPPDCPVNKELLRELEFMEEGPFILEKSIELGKNKIILSKVNTSFRF